MEEKHAVITGVGVIAPNGIGKQAFWDALTEGRSGIKPITLFDTTFLKVKLAGECTDFNAESILGAKGLRNLSRATKFLCCAAKLSIEDAGLQITEDNTDDIGVVTANTLSTVWDLAEFTKDAVQEGPQFVNPALFPGTTINFPSSQISIWHKIKGFNTTISTGYTAGLDALKYAVDFIKLGRAKAILAGGVESLSFHNFLGFYRVDFLAGLRGEEISCPFDRRHNGIIYGEGSAVLVIEDEECALKRGARIYARVLSVETSFDAFRSVKYNPRGKGLKQSMGKAIKNSGLNKDEIDYICAAANSVSQQDKLETACIKEIFDIYAKKIPVSSIKSMIGEGGSSSGTLQIAASVGSLTGNFIPPTINYAEPDCDCDLDYTANVSRKKEIKNILINSFGPEGSNTTAIISKYD
jgi:3-oxoacyl-[acyl-carrier-protein] synthase II